MFRCIWCWNYHHNFNTKTIFHRLQNLILNQCFVRNRGCGDSFYQPGIAAITSLLLTKYKFRRFLKPIMTEPPIKYSIANRFSLPGKACGYSFDHAHNIESWQCDQESAVRAAPGRDYRWSTGKPGTRDLGNTAERHG